MLYASTTERQRSIVHLYIVRVVVVVVNGVLTKVCSCGICIDGYGFSFNYVGRGNTTDNTFQSLYDFLLSIMWYVIYMHIHIHG